MEFQCGEKKFNATVCKNKNFYELLVSDEARVLSRFAEMKEDFGLSDSAVTKVFIKVKTVSYEMFIRSFQFKILNNFHNSRLAEIGYVQDGSCTFSIELAQKLSIIYFMNVCILTSFGKISRIFLVCIFW